MINKLHTIVSFADTPHRNWTSARLRAGDTDPDRVLLLVSKLEVRNRQAVESRTSFVELLPCCSRTRWSGGPSTPSASGCGAGTSIPARPWRASTPLQSGTEQGAGLRPRHLPVRGTAPECRDPRPGRRGQNPSRPRARPRGVSPGVRGLLRLDGRVAGGLPCQPEDILRSEAREVRSSRAESPKGRFAGRDRGIWRCPKVVRLDDVAPCFHACRSTRRCRSGTPAALLGTKKFDCPV